MIRYNGYVIGKEDFWLKATEKPVDPYNPLGLPPYTIRLKFTEGYTPTFSKGTAVQVSLNPSIWDLTFEDTNWSNLLYEQWNLLEVLGANTSGVTNMDTVFYSCGRLTSVALFDTSSVTYMRGMFFRCSSLTSVQPFDTSNVTDMAEMFNECSSLQTVPLFDTSKVLYMDFMFRLCNLATVPLFDTSAVTNMDWMFQDCVNVQSGALALYRQASSQAIVPEHNGAFRNCGSNTVTGRAEWNQIPEDWK
jgi:surface protein